MSVQEKVESHTDHLSEQVYALAFKIPSTLKTLESIVEDLS